MQRRINGFRDDQWYWNITWEAQDGFISRGRLTTIKWFREQVVKLGSYDIRIHVSRPDRSVTLSTWRYTQSYSPVTLILNSPY